MRPMWSARSFNPRPRRGGDVGLEPPQGGRPKKGFSIHAPAGGATQSMTRIFLRDGFQSTPPQGGRLGACTPTNTSGTVFQSTPPQGGRPSVSIHAPAGGATVRVRTAFQSTPPQGGRLAKSSNGGLRSHPRFNPRPRRGGDVAMGVARNSVLGASFNPRPRRGGDPLNLDGVTVRVNAPAGGATLAPRTKGFNPRPRRGGDLVLLTARSTRFNPRPRRGGDSPPK